MSRYDLHTYPIIIIIKQNVDTVVSSVDGVHTGMGSLVVARALQWQSSVVETRTSFK